MILTQGQMDRKADEIRYFVEALSVQSAQQRIARRITMLFEVAILEVPTKKENDEGTGEEKLVFGPTFVVAKDGQSAAIKAVMENVEKTAGIDKSRMSVLVRPFA